MLAGAGDLYLTSLAPAQAPFSVPARDEGGSQLLVSL